MAATIAVFCGCLSAAAQEQPKPAVLCGGDTIGRGTAGRVIDGRTFMLNDGREVRLAGIEVPPLALKQDAVPVPGGTAAKDGLDALVGGDEVLLRRAEIPSDRYQRLVAYVYTVRDGEELFAQSDMISSGVARVGDSVGNPACAAELIGQEYAARQAKLGLWADSYYEVLDADNPSDVLARRGQFALVGGKVLSVRTSGATTYMNFGRRWSEDFTVTILKRNERSFRAAGLDLKSLAGRRVLVRGWIKQRGGPGGSPWIEAAHPEQIGLDDRE